MVVRFDSKQALLDFFDQIVIQDEEIIQILLVIDEEKMLENE